MAVLFCAACSDRSWERRPDTAAIHYATLVLEGRYDEVVKGMASCDEASPSYRKRMTHFYRRMREERHPLHGRWTGVELDRTALADSGRTADVFLRLLFEDGEAEPVVYSLVSDGKCWRLR